MPRIHLGVYLTSGKETANAVKWALEVMSILGLENKTADEFFRLVIERMGGKRAYKTEQLTLSSVDSAQMYHNEREVGSSILEFISSPSNTSSLKRKDIHFTSKLASNTSYDAARKSIKQSIEQSGLGYIDLFLLHSPYGGKAKRLECWKAVEDAIEEGEVKSGGVSNFGVKHVSRTIISNDKITRL